MKYIEFGPSVTDSVPFKDISYLELWPPFVRQSRNNCTGLAEGNMKNICLQLYPTKKETHNSIFPLGSPFKTKMLIAINYSFLIKSY